VAECWDIGSDLSGSVTGGEIMDIRAHKSLSRAV
jgi:hypothetical protein